MADDFVLIAWRLNNIPAAQKIILMALASLTEKNSTHCSATIKELSKISLLSDRTVRRQLKWLAENNYLATINQEKWKGPSQFTLQCGQK